MVSPAIHTDESIAVGVVLLLAGRFDVHGRKRKPVRRPIEKARQNGFDRIERTLPRF